MASLAALWAGLTRVAIVAASVAALAVGALVVRGARRARVAAEVRQTRESSPAEPWRWEYAWNERGALDVGIGREAAQSAAWGVAAGVFGGAFTFMGFMILVGAEGPRRLLAIPFLAIGLLVDVVALRLLTNTVRLTARRLKYGRGVALFDAFPFRRGEALRVYVEAPDALPPHALPTATLRCVQERYVTTSTEPNSTSLRCFAVYEDTAPAEVIATGHGRRALRVSFQIPNDAPSTDLAAHPCRYWEVEVDARTDGVDYGARFLVPVY